jgi:hypothetical protein
VSKPSYPEWIPDNNSSYIVAPSTGFKATGWAAAAKPPARYFNWFFNLVSQWMRFLGPDAPDLIIGAGSYCTHADLPTAVADSGTGTNLKVLVVDSIAAVNATINLTKSGWKVFFAPGVTYTKGTAATCISCQATGVEIRRARFSGFTTAITGTSAWTYGRVVDCNFATCTTNIDDSSVPAGKKPVDLANISE